MQGAQQKPELFSTAKIVERQKVPLTNSNNRQGIYANIATGHIDDLEKVYDSGIVQLTTAQRPFEGSVCAMVWDECSLSQGQKHSDDKHVLQALRTLRKDLGRSFLRATIWGS
ncbi:hypothetical protein AbraIFM66951_007894 [Aspergillus brasiliensis]|nr:hypothetical protein AbraIFM66951_007894 [Aspergillus brasiliensis]